LEFYFRFRSRPFRRNQRVILHLTAEFRPNQSTRCGNMTSYPFLKMAAATAKILLSVSYLLMSLPSESQSLSANQISTRYLNWRLRYNYVRFRNTNVRHIGIYFRFQSGPSFRNRRVIPHPAAESSKSEHPPLKYDVISIFKMAAVSHVVFCICFGVMADHPRSAFRGLNSDLKSLVRRINSSGDIAM